MTNKNSCYTYFRIVGDFDPRKITKLLNLEPDEYWYAGDLRKNGTRYDFSSWKYGTCSEYDVDTSEQMRKTISGLLDKIDLLNKIRSENDASFVLEVVPTVCVGESTPCLAPPLDVIDFCHLTRTEMDIDMYVVEREYLANGDKRLGREESAEIREKFIDKFVDVNTERYKKISEIDPDKTVDGQYYLFLWDTFLDIASNTINYYKALDYLHRLDRDVYVMVDKCFIVDNENRGLEDILRYDRDLRGDTVLKANSRVLADIVKRDNLGECSYEKRQLPEDIYIFDDGFEWFIAITHEFFDDSFDENKRICFSNLNIDNE